MKTITSEYFVTNYDEVSDLIQSTEQPITITENNVPTLVLFPYNQETLQMIELAKKFKKEYCK